jgi:hypothetical protein
VSVVVSVVGSDVPTRVATNPPAINSTIAVARFWPTRLEHAPLSDRRGEIALKRDGDPGTMRLCALSSGFGSALAMCGIPRPSCAVERLRTIETLFTILLRFIKTTSPIFGGETYQQLAFSNSQGDRLACLGLPGRGATGREELCG